MDFSLIWGHKYIRLKVCVCVYTKTCVYTLQCVCGSGVKARRLFVVKTVRKKTKRKLNTGCSLKHIVPYCEQVI